MLLETPSLPSLPLLNPSTHFSFYPRAKNSLCSHPVDHILRSPSSSSASGNTGFEFGSTRNVNSRLASRRWKQQLGGDDLANGNRSLFANRKKDLNSRAIRRALSGRAMAGTALAEEAIELSEEENALEEERINIDSFGHRFLLPFGRRLTQMEMEAGQPQSPTPSDIEHDHRQEDQNGVDPAARDLELNAQFDGGRGTGTGAGGAGVGDEDAEGEGGVIDLDASIEDRDAEDDEDEDGYEVDLDEDVEGEGGELSGEMLELDDNAVRGSDDDGDMSVED